MYSNIPGVQVLLSLLKQYNIKHLVISPGTRNTPLVHSVEEDSFFKCYSVVDERSAGFFALGLAEELDCPVCVTCTAATATCNYMPAIKEAFERNIKLIALTADQDTYSKFHMGDQNIDQINMFDRYVNYAIDIPKILNNNDYWYFNRAVNEAFQCLKDKSGPIQINFRMNYSLDELSFFPENQIKKTRYIERYSDDTNWKELAEILKNKKVIVFCASEYYNTNTAKELILEFSKKTGAVILADYYSNIIDENVINPSVLGDIYRGKKSNNLKPDIIILFGSVIYAPVKGKRNLFGNCDTWLISEDARINDGFRNVKKLFKCKTEMFFDNINRYVQTNSDDSFYKEWKNLMSEIKYPELNFTHFNAIKKVTENMLDNSIVHMSVLDAIRISNYSKMKSSISCFANIGADGIDGALSTFLGQAKSTDKMAYLIIGDLSLMYDMNAIYMNIPNNVRIIVINNYAGAEFHKNFGLKRIETLNKHIAAGHHTKIKEVSTIGDFEYLSAENEEELKKSLEKINQNSDKPMLLEIFTDADKDANKLKEFWNMNIPNFEDSKAKLKNMMKKLLGQNIIKKIKR